MNPAFNVGAYVPGPPNSPRGLVTHAQLLEAYADGVMAESGETREAYLSHFVFGVDMRTHFAATGGDSQREQLDAAAGVMRKFCDAGAGVLAASAVARQKGNAGSTYGVLNLASFRGSSELEYGRDAAYLHEPGGGGRHHTQVREEQVRAGGRHRHPVRPGHADVLRRPVGVGGVRRRHARRGQEREGEGGLTCAC